jgi:transcriptional regulator with XRE-family HTH domain
MGTRERPADRGRLRAVDSLRRVGREHKQARTAAGLSLRAVGAATETSHGQLSRFERGLLVRVNIDDLGAWCAVVGLDLSMRVYPSGDPIRDRGQLDLLERCRERIHPSLRWRTEVPLSIQGDLRAWDAEVSGGSPRWRIRVEAETNIADGQALERRLGLKVRDDPCNVILLVADTRANRRVLATLAPGLRDLLPLNTRQVLSALAAGRDPGAGGIVIL